MTQEEKAKRYDKLLLKLQKAKVDNNVCDDKYCCVINDIVPELKESEDEKIRKEILDCFVSMKKQGCFPSKHKEQYDAWVAWLEKQGEQKQEFNYPEFDFNDILAIQCCMETAKKVQEDKELYNKLLSLHSRLYDACCLEKQGEHRQDPCKHCKMTYSTCYSFPCDEKKAFEQGKSALEAINEEKVDNANKVETKDYSSIDPHFGKSIDKVEQEFRIGDWIIANNTKLVILMRSITDGYFKLEDTEGNIYSDDTSPSKDFWHLWTIQDAKDGDILVYNNSIFIFNEIYKNCLIYYGIYENDKFHNDKYYSFLVLDTIDINNIHPATKEQRDLLFQKMHEAGYEWDAKKKLLRKIEYDKSKPNFCHHEVDLSNCSEEYRKAYYDGWNNCNQQYSQLKAEQTFIWSEEDEKKRNLLIDILNVNHPNGCFKVNPANTLNMEAMHTEELVSWLKSLKDKYIRKADDEHYELEEFAKIVRSNLTGISKTVQTLFENKYLKLTGKKMYGNFKD